MMNGPLCLRIPVTLLTLVAACVQDDAPAADFIINYDGVMPVANTGPSAAGAPRSGRVDRAEDPDRYRVAPTSSAV